MPDASDSMPDIQLTMVLVSFEVASGNRVGQLSSEAGASRWQA